MKTHKFLEKCDLTKKKFCKLFGIHITRIICIYLIKNKNTNCLKNVYIIIINL